MCTGRIDPATVAGAFKKGLDGLMVVGCYFGDCHYITGNHQGQAKMNMTQKLLRYVGLNQDRAIDMVIVEETDVQEILLNLSEGPLSVKDLAGRMNMPASRVFRYVTALKRKEMVALDKIDGQTPYYRLIPQEVQASGR